MQARLYITRSFVYFTLCFQFFTALLKLLMMTSESMLSKRPVLKFTAILFFLQMLFSSQIYCIPNQIKSLCNSLQTITTLLSQNKPVTVGDWPQLPLIIRHQELRHCLQLETKIGRAEGGLPHLKGV